ncbi:exodeoxyribonuclease III [Vandammella animalimorsus]|uniref:exodeoxyribonuclease III n=1 Tax=Vandammella animalimorsus TaxID=2029117 RepID=UPI001552A0FC|nr:exodeoxyribonuclease III [Vandammella animalimorsus]
MSNDLFQLTSLNLNGIRSAVSKGLVPWLEEKRPDCMCVQEVKAQLPDLEKAQLTCLAGMQGYFHLAQKKGYSGVGIYTRHTPSDVRYGWDQGEFDAEGRCIELRFDTPTRRLSIISAYFPSGSSGEERQAAKYRFLDGFFPYLNALQRQREFILCGDINIAHQAIDLKNWRSNQKNSGFLPEERAWMTKLLSERDEHREPLVDVYRTLQPEATDSCYTWWSNRGQAYANNVGWRLDYHLATPALAAQARTESIYKGQKFSDHAPLTIGYALAL